MAALLVRDTASRYDVICTTNFCSDTLSTTSFRNSPAAWACELTICGIHRRQASTAQRPTIATARTRPKSVLHDPVGEVVAFALAAEKAFRRPVAPRQATRP